MVLNRFGFEIRPISPMLVGGDRSFALFNETRNFVPGSVLRGALAEILLRECKDSNHRHCPETAADEDCEFMRLFYHGSEPIFDHFYPTFTGDPSLPLPLTAWTCKAFPGFRTREPVRRQPHGVFDILVRQASFERVITDEQLLPPILYESRCPECGSDMKPQSGFYCMPGTGDYRYSGPEAPILRTARTAIDRNREVSADAMLYVLEMMEPAVNFTLRGSVLIDEEKVELLQTALSRTRRLGADRSRGLGRVEIVPLGPEPNSSQDLVDRINTFNGSLTEEWAFYHRLHNLVPPTDSGWYFTVDLLSEALLHHCGLPTLKLHPEKLGIDASVKLLRSFTKAKIVGGWHAAAGLPRSTEMATAAGSVFVYRVENADLQVLLSRIESLETNGVGRERARGFGRVQICSPFHMEVV